MNVRTSIALAASAAAVLSACADDGPQPSVAAITISMSDFEIDVPDVVPAGLVQIHGLNDGEYIHQAVVAELPIGVSAADYVDEMLADPAQALTEADFRGGVQLVRPDDEQTVTVELEPGRYVVLCNLPGPEVGSSHLAHDMWAEFIVEGTGSNRASQIDAVGRNGTIELIDFAFDLPETIQSGNTYQVVNTGTQVHEIGMAELADGATRDDVIAYFTGQAPEGAAAPFTDLSGVGFLSPGKAQTLAIDDPPGRYVFICYILDPNDGLPHFMKGMISVVDVV